MKSFIFSLFCILQLFSSSLGFICPVDDQFRPINGAYRDPEFCGAYYQCINGTAFPQNCPLGLFFRFSTLDCKIRTCTEPELADCPPLGNATIENEPLECKSGQIDFKTPCFTKTNECAPNLNATVASLVDCRIYYHCQNGVAWPQQCPPGYFFNPIVNPRDCTVQLCVPPQDAKCPSDGNWSEWSAWGDCEPRCGGEGIRTRTRDCNNPPPSNGGRECSGLPIEIENCQTPPCPSGEKPCFMVSLQSTISVSEGRIQWSSIDVNQDNLYNPLTSRLNIKEAGVYYFAMTATMSRQTGAHLRLQNIGREIDLKRDKNEDGIEQISRSGLYFLNPLFSPYINQMLPTASLLGSNAGKDTNWVGFKYSTDNYIFVGSDSSSLEQNYIPLNILVNMRGYSIGASNTEFINLEGGKYFIHFGCGIVPNVNLRISIYSNNHNTPYSRIQRLENQMASSDQLSRSFINALPANSKLQYRLDGGHNSTIGLPTYLMAFKLNDSLPILFVHQSYRYPSSCSTFMQLMAFNVVIEDTTNSWTIRTREYKVPVTGTYYIDISVVVILRNTVEAYVEVNNIRKFRLLKFGRSHGRSELISKGGLIQMFKDDILTVRYRGCMTADDMVSSMVIFLLP
ncbi:DgyrCDS14696 [Dimorphilus gyrociliatus]|uniref:DgyrCDS14696 n=1 Tax=Dimorphilus gyrociliatus TaxID=2664684 RepID=A0A7I8WEP2_9ANNE|nr:DgyrCDS14696 [Dimorphilus gyrociliatus]